MIKGKYIVKIDGEVVAEKDNLITTNGFFMINRHLAKSSVEWAGSLAIGSMTTSASISDKTLYYELERMPITLKSYQKINPRYTVLTSQIVSSVATMSFKSITSPSVASGYKILISGVSGYNGNYTLTSFQPLQATITNVSASSGTITYTAANNFTPGEQVVITGVNPTAYNITGTIATASSSQFTVVNSATGSYTSGGTAVQSYGYQVTFVSPVTSTASLAYYSTNTALLSSISDSLGNPVYNNEIVVKATVDPASSFVINEVGVLPLNLKNRNDSLYKKITDFSEQSSSDASLSAWTDNTASAQLSVVGSTTIGGSSSTAGWTWTLGSSLITVNVASTAGMKVGNYVYVSGSTQISGTSSINGSYFAINQINGNFQVILTAGTNTTGVIQSAYGGTLSINSTSFVPASTSGKFNISLPASHTISLNNLIIDASSFSSTDTLALLYYGGTSGSAISMTIALTDVGGNTYTCTNTKVYPTSSGLNVAFIQLNSSFPASGAVINQITILSDTAIILDELKFINNNYWSAHPYSSKEAIVSASGTGSVATYTTATSHNFTPGNSVVISGYLYVPPQTYTITSVPSRTTFTVASTQTSWSGGAPFAVSTVTPLMPPEYQLTSRSIFANPVVKNAGQQMDIEYHLQVT
jgi:hypothetical protein